MSKFVSFGDLRLPGTSGGVTIKVHYKASGKVDEKEHDGADDGTATWKGRKPRDVEIELSWIYDARDEEVEGGPIHQEVCDVLEEVSCAGDNAGKPWDFAESDERRQKIANVKTVLVKDLDLSPPDYAAGTCTAKIGADSWVKPAPKGAGKGATPTTPRKYTEPGGKTTVNGFGGNDNTITFPTTPKVVP